MHKIKIKGAGGPRKRLTARNFCNEGNCRWLSKNKKSYRPTSLKNFKEAQKKDLILNSLDKAILIVETAEQLGM